MSPIDGALREKVETVPRKAFRETVANALAHRTWDVSAPARISMRPSEMEVLSPGGLVPGMAVGKARARKHAKSWACGYSSSGTLGTKTPGSS